MVRLTHPTATRQTREAGRQAIPGPPAGYRLCLRRREILLHGPLPQPARLRPARKKTQWIFSQGEYTENAGNNHLKEEYFLFFVPLLGLFSMRQE
jgi:hypothetical protein